MRNKTAVFVAVLSLLTTNSFAGTAKSENLDQDIEKRLSYFSNHSSAKEINWDEVCVTSNKANKKFGYDMDDNSDLDTMIEQHEVMGEEMLKTSVSDEKKDTRSVDDVARKAFTDPDGQKTVDDVIEEQEIFKDSEKSLQSETVSSSITESKPVQFAKASQDREEAASEESNANPYIHSQNVNTNSFARTPEKSNNTMEIGFEYNRFRYTEPIIDLLDKGNLYGAYASYTLRPQKERNSLSDVIDVFKLEGRFNYGSVDYKSSGSGTIDDIPDWTYEVRLLGGKDLLLAENVRLTPMVGFGYRYLNDDSSGMTSSVGDLGYEREANYFYVPVAVELAARINERWIVAPILEYDIFIKGHQESHLSDVPGYPDVINDQKSGYGIRGSVKLIREFKSFSMVLEPYIRFWHIEDSEIVTASSSVLIITGLEPENKSTEYGLRFGAMF